MVKFINLIKGINGVESRKRSVPLSNVRGVYLYLIIKNNIVAVKISDIPFARMIGKSLIKIPYTNHKITPVVNTIYIPNDKSLVCLVCMVFSACGKNEKVVQVAATNPSTVINSISIKLLEYVYIFLYLDSNIISPNNY